MRRRAVPPRSLADLPLVDRFVSTTEGCVDPVMPAVLGPRLGADPDAVRAFLTANGVALDAADACVPYVAVTGGADGVSSLHLATPAPPAAVIDPASGADCAPIRRVIEVPAPSVNPERLGPLLDVPVRIRWQVEMLLPEMVDRDDDDQEAPPTIVRLALERRGANDPERLQSIEVLDAVTKRRIDAAWWVERPDGPGVLFGLNGADYERLLWNSAVHFDRVSRGIGPPTRLQTRVVRQGKGKAKKVVTRVVKPRGYHLGIDMMADRGADVHVVSDGTVSFAGTARGFGKLVIVDHGQGYRTYYAHLSAIANGLHSGDVLLRGDVLGLVGSTGHSTGPHLHFETRLGNDYIDPQDASRQLEFWFLNREEQAWIAQQMLAPSPAMVAVPAVPAGFISSGAGAVEPALEGLAQPAPEVPPGDEAARIVVGGRPALPSSVSMIVDEGGAVSTETGLARGDVAAACRAYTQMLAPERPEIPTPVVRKAARRPTVKKAPAAASGRTPGVKKPAVRTAGKKKAV